MMKKRFLNVVTLIVIALSMTSCGLVNKIFHNNSDNEPVVAGSIQNMYLTTYNFDGRQLDSLCRVDTIPSDLADGWLRKVYTDYETNKPVIRYMYIKELNDNYEIIYFVTPKDDMYVVSKRQVLTEEEK